MFDIYQDEIPEEDAQKEFQMLAQGNTAEIYQYGENRILKLFREQMPHTPIENEYHRSILVQKSLENVPAVFEILQYRGRMGIVYEQIKGVDMIRLFLSHPFQLKKYSRLLAQIHMQMHTKDIDVQYSVKEKLKYDIGGVTDLAEEEKKKIVSYLETLPEKSKLCHFDYHPGNIIFREKEPMIIDWMTACTGDPNADVCRTKLILETGELIHMNSLLRRFLHLIMKQIGTEYIKEYRVLSGVTDEEIDRWTLPVAAARLAEWLTPHERARLVGMVKKELASFYSTNHTKNDN